MNGLLKYSEETINKLKETIVDRGSSYADFADNCRILFDILHAIEWSGEEKVGKRSPTNDVLDACAFNIAQKLARLHSGDVSHKDSWIDIAGYAILAHAQLLRQDETTEKVAEGRAVYEKHDEWHFPCFVRGLYTREIYEALKSIPTTYENRIPAILVRTKNGKIHKESRDVFDRCEPTAAEQEPFLELRREDTADTQKPKFPKDAWMTSNWHVFATGIDLAPGDKIKIIRNSENTYENAYEAATENGQAINLPRDRFSFIEPNTYIE